MAGIVWPNPVVLLAHFIDTSWHTSKVLYDVNMPGIVTLYNGYLSPYNHSAQVSHHLVYDGDTISRYIARLSTKSQQEGDKSRVVASSLCTLRYPAVPFTQVLYWLVNMPPQ